MARVYAIASAKGGVGKTTTTANLGSTLAGTGADVVVIDGDIGMANLGAALGVQPDGATLHDVLSDAAEPAAAAYDGPAGLTVVPGDTSLEAFAAADPQRLDAVVEAFDDADYVLIDVGAGVSHETGVPLSIADAVILVSTPERDALVDTEKTRQLTDRLGGVVAGAVITRTDEATPLEEVVSGTLSADVLTTIPDDEAVRESIAVGEPLSSYAPHSDAAAAYRQLAAELTGIDPSAPESTPADADSETRETLEARDDQLSDSLSEGGVTINAGDDAGDAGEERPLEEYPTADDTAAGASKWAEAATGTVGDVDSAVEDADLGAGSPESTDPDPDPSRSDGPSVDPEATRPDDGDGDEETVPPDAIPFSGAGDDESASDAAEDPPADDTAQTTVLGAAMDDEDGAVDTGSTADASEDDGSDEAVVIPDAEETAGAADDVDDSAEMADDDENDEEEKRGFFSRLFR
ncbi:cell division ATPase MinD [Halohasta salina]|uniref:cell division ATPase MinD n=1 Tax=Halohasta salina TaxID=2961621 RepID=UPI0020A5C60A|nr:cell division ATPase MinD [Halohasta salina]